MFKQCRFSSIKLRDHLNKVPTQNNNLIDKYGTKILYGINQPYSLLHYSSELDPMAEIVNYIYTTFALSNINVGPNFHLLQKRYRVFPLENTDLNILYNFERKNRFDKYKTNNYNVLYYYNIDGDVTLETYDGIYKPKEFDLLFVNNNYKHIIKRNICNFDILRFKFY